MSREVTFHILINAIFLVLTLLLGLLPDPAARYVAMFHAFLFFSVLSGILTGAAYGAGLGIIAPILYYLLYHRFLFMPETVTYFVAAGTAGLVAGLFYGWFRTSIGATVAAVIAWCFSFGVTKAVSLLASGESYFIANYVSDVFVSFWPGIALTLLTAPLITVILRKKGAMWVLRSERDD